MLKKIVKWLTQERGKHINDPKVGFYTPMDIAPGERIK